MPKVEVVLDERSKGLVPLEAQPVQVGGLALVPCGRGDDVDDCRDAFVLCLDRLDPQSATWRDEHDAHGGTGRVQAGKPKPVVEGGGDAVAVGHRIPWTRA